ncbi:MAG: spore gernimation protein GerPD [Bacillus sp. (in: firmicutes)]
MNFQVYNRELFVQNIKITGVSSSSLVMVGDTETIQLASTFDTPAESLIIGPFVPLSQE